jgi:soluble lytic murein transglycosylase-like protein
MHDPIESAPRNEALKRRRRMARRHATRRLRKAVIATATVFTVTFLVRPERTEAAPRGVPAVAAINGLTANSTEATGAADAPRASQAPSSPLSAAPSIWRRPGDVLKRDKSADVPAFAFGTDPRLHERHESLNRWHSIYSFSSRYRIKPDLARRIYDAAVTAGIEPELGFRLVRVESVFDPQAESPVGALGLTQLMPSTARVFEPHVTREQLLTPDVNLRIGFRYLRGLIREYDGDLKLALLVYNRGPAAVGRAMAMGKSPANGYETIVTKGYRGRGTLD